MNTYDFSKAANWLKLYTPQDVINALQDEALALANVALDRPDEISPQEHILRMQAAVNFACDFLKTIQVAND